MSSGVVAGRVKGEVFNARVLLGCNVKSLAIIYLEIFYSSDSAKLFILEKDDSLINNAVSSAKSLGIVIKEKSA